MGEMGVIRGEIGRKSRHKPIRWVMKNAGSMVQRIKPVMLMSPISVAQFLPPGTVTFDLLVIDEASQIRPEDALGVIARARQIVVVGDQKQLPPTSFFDRLVDDGDGEEEDEDIPAGATAADMESILSLCEARGLRSRMLEWHYRSRDPSLIRVSNAEFYGDNLVLPPSPLQLDPNYGLKFRRVPGVYARGKTATERAGTNKIEAQYIVQAVVEHARNSPDLSLGVVAFSKAQSDTLTEALEYERRRDPVLDAFLREGRAEDVFVKNIENVQGDERDVILISVGYGPQEPNGRLASMSFGPINGEGGERRLNVLFSRARIRCEVFASFDPGDIDPSRSSREGPRVLKRFLDFAKSGIIEERIATGLDADSPFEEDVARVIRSLGYEADLQVGTAGFRIDIGVRHPERPGQYIVAVECDGATYHSALWARERDRLRQDVLESLGWRFHRIWSTDWFLRREHEVRRLAEALLKARVASSDGIAVRGANERGILQPIEQEIAPEGPIEIGHLELKAPAYKRAEVLVRNTVEPHDAPRGRLAI
ncbi:AAA domain-containing protein [Seohaeicola zhoushanensis]